MVYDLCGQHAFKISQGVNHFVFILTIGHIKDILHAPSIVGLLK